MKTPFAAACGFGLALLLGPTVPAAEPAAPTAESEPFHLYLPEKTWSLDLSLTGFNLSENAMSPDLRRRSIAAIHPASRLAVSAALEPAESGPTAVGLRDQAAAQLRRLGRAAGELKLYEKDNRAYLARTLRIKEEPLATAFYQREVQVFFVHEATAIAVHVAQNRYTDDDEPQFTQFLSQLTINTTFQPPIPDVIAIGKGLFRLERYRQAAACFQRARDREKLQATLPPDEQAALIDLLGLAYDFGGERNRARESFAAGIAQYPDYPSCYYHLARIDGAEGKLDEALKNLRLALLHRMRFPAGEKLPNPAADSAFRPIANDPRFRKLAEEFASALPPQAL